MIYSIGNKRCQLFSQFSLGPKSLWDQSLFGTAGVDQRGRAAACSSRRNPRHGTAGTGAGKSWAAVGSWGHRGLTSYCSNTPSSVWRPCGWAGGAEELSPPASKRHPRAREGEAPQGRWGGRRGTLPSLTQTDGRAHRDCCDFPRIAAFRTAALAERGRRGSGKHGFP